MARVGQVEGAVSRGGKTTAEVRGLVTSLPRSGADGPRRPGWVRGHWSIENRSHDVGDVTPGEGASRLREGSGPEVMAAVRNATIGLLRLGGASDIAAAVRRNASRIGDLFTKPDILKQ